MTEMMRRRRALMAVKKEGSVLFEWDYTEGVSPKLNTYGNRFGTGIVSMESDGLLLQGGSNLYSIGGVAPNIPPMTESYKATITYSGLVAPSTNGEVSFFHYHDTERRVRIYQQQRKLYAVNGNGTRTLLNFGLEESGTVTIEYDSVAGTVKFTQGANTHTVTIGSTTEWAQPPGIAGASKGSTNSSVKIQHIKIERV